nr:immunoglobulin light chain junction region [Macaca mulatta]
DYYCLLYYSSAGLF